MSRRSHFVLWTVLSASFAAAVILSGSLIRNTGQIPSSQRPTASSARLPLVFEENVGQSAGDVRFLVRGKGYTLGLNGAETLVALNTSKAPVAKSALLKMKLLSANPQAKTAGENRLKAKINYFLGNDRSKWRTDVPAYERVRTAGVYPGIDLLHYGQAEGALEYDFVVAPGSDPSQIGFTIEGAKDAKLAANGDLVLTTAAGEIRQQKPVAYQEDGGQRTPVECAFVLTEGAAPQVRFALDDYDGDRPLIVDPVLQYSTFLGGAGTDTGQAVAFGPGGRVYVAGNSDSAGFPLTPSALMGDQEGQDGFVAVLDPTLEGANSLLYATYLGGSGFGTESVSDIAVDPNGRACVTGWTYSADFPTTDLPYQDGFGRADAYVTVLDPAQNGVSSLVYSSCLGGDDLDQGRSIAVGPSNRLYISGETRSTDFPVAANAFQIIPKGSYDSFAAIVDPSLEGAESLIYSTFFGAAANELTSRIAVDQSGRLYLGGTTTSSGLPVTATAFQKTRNGPSDAFLAVMDPAESGSGSLLFSTYLGGTDRDSIGDIAVDAMGRVCLVGTTLADFPITPTAFQTSQRALFVSVVDPWQSPGGFLSYSTYFGGSDPLGQESDPRLAVDASGRVYLAGTSRGANLPDTPAALQTHQGLEDAFVSVFDPTQSGAGSLLFSTYLGSGGRDFCTGIAVNGSGQLAVAGYSEASSYPTTDSRFDGETDGFWDAFVSVLDLNAEAPGCLQVNATSNSTSLALSWRDTSTRERRFAIERKEAEGAFMVIGYPDANATSALNQGLTPGTHYAYRVRYVWPDGTMSAPSVVAAATTHVLPPAPSDLTAAGVSTRLIRLTWTDNSADETGFRIERKTGMGAFAQIANAPPNAETYLDSAQTPNTAYTYRLRAFRAVDNSAWSNEATGATLSSLPAPTNLTASNLRSLRIDLAWTDNATDEAGYKLERKVEGGEFALIATLGPNVTTYAQANLTENVVYTYRARAFRGTEYSAYSNEASAKAIIPPNPPRDLVAAPHSATEIDLRWYHPSTEETGFEIQRKTEDGMFETVVTLPATINKTRLYTDGGLARSTVYIYRVRTVRGTDYSEFSNEATAKTMPLSSPSNLVVTARGSRSLQIDWKDNSEDETYFSIEYRSDFNPGPFKLFNTVAANTETVFYGYALGGISANVRYVFRMRAHRGNDVSGYSNEFTITMPPPMTPPSNLLAKSGLRRVDLTWQDNTMDEDGFVVWRIGRGVLAKVGPNVTSYSDTTVTESIRYGYYVTAFKLYNGITVDQSDGSNTSYARPHFPFIPPTDLTATAILSTKVRLNWKDTTGDETGFTFERKTGSGEFQAVGSVGPNIVTADDANLTPSTEYTYRVRADRGTEHTGYSNEATVVTLEAVFPLSKLVATPLNSAEVRLTWTNPNTMWSRIEMEMSRTNLPDDWDYKLGTTSRGSFTHRGFSLGSETVYYRARVIRDNAPLPTEMSEWAYSNPAMMPPGPAAPSNFTATPLSGTELRLDWEDNCADETGYEFYASTSDGPDVPPTQLGANVTTFTCTGLVPGADYTFYIRTHRGAYERSGWVAIHVEMPRPSANASRQWSSSAPAAGKSALHSRSHSAIPRGSGTSLGPVQSPRQTPTRPHEPSTHVRANRTQRGTPQPARGAAR